MTMTTATRRSFSPSSLRKRSFTCHVITLLACVSSVLAITHASPFPSLPVATRNQILAPDASSAYPGALHGGFRGEGRFREILPKAPHLHRRADLSLKFNYTNMYMFCYRESYARMPSQACRKTFRGIGPMCLRSCPAFGGKWVNCAYGCSPSTKMCIKTLWKQASAVTFLTYKVKLPAVDPFIDPAFSVAEKLSAFWKKIFPPALARLKKRSDFKAIVQKTITSRALNALFIASYAKPAQGNDRSTVTFVDPKTEDKAAELAEYKQSHYVLSEHALKTGKGLVGTLGFLDFTINLEDAAKFDPTGAVDFMLQFGHLPCGKVNCIKCYTVSAQACTMAGSCVNGKCGAAAVQADGATCTDFGNGGNSYAGTCSSGVCASSVVASYYMKKQQTSMWIPEGYEDPSTNLTISPTVYTTSEKEYLDTSLQFWDVLASQSGSCSFNNGGCGSFICKVNKEKNSSSCINPRDHGFAPAPMATNFPSGETLEYQYPVKPLDCLSLCKINSKCVLAVTTWGNECWLKASIGDPAHAETYQAFKQL
ncbi:hypothetical protein CLOM_g6596 [Closterium sp. NIES-68]|nr:hypothetical protein CLOM_g9303 [Closterium sp. NIES-68]GJP47406.1 hypothetical protein CLOM_g6596 [Closterium sp. NIES-68]GJP69576.1 hypothetical protein CLOP_g575 [Closterium sp. NIES-67]